MNRHDHGFGVRNITALSPDPRHLVVCPLPEISDSASRPDYPGVLEKEAVPCVAVQDDFRVGQPLRPGVAPERVDHDVVGAICVLLCSVQVMECFHAGSGPTLR
jgi:hypothetical protein